MFHSYLYNRLKLWPFLRGWFPFYARKQLLNPVTLQAQGKKLVWRNNYTDTFKITSGYADKPVELGNFLFLRTREREMMRNRVERQADTVRYKNFYTTGSDQKMLKKIEEDLDRGLESLHDLLSVLKHKRDYDVPVAFASNALYALEKNGLRNEEIYQKVLFPILKKKAQYLHADGLAGAIWVLGQFNSGDGELVNELLKHYEDKKFGTDVVFVSNAKLSSEAFTTADGVHGMEFESTKEYRDMYFKDHITCLELYEGLKNLSSQSLSSGASGKISEVMGDLESKQKITSDSHWFYKQLTESPAAVSTS